MIKTNALRYLGCDETQIPSTLDTLVDQCIEEVKALAQPAFVHREAHLLKHPLCIEAGHICLAFPALEEMLENCDDCVLVAVTLGVQIDRRIKYYGVSDMAKMSVFDAVASSYVEFVCDQFEADLQLGKRTMRFCPGYGNVPVTLNKELARVLDCEKHIGLHVEDSAILLPQKSMIGLIGIGDNKKIESCEHCIKIKDCELRKRGLRCYKNE